MPIEDVACNTTLAVMSATVIQLFPLTRKGGGSRQVSDFPAILREIRTAVAYASPEEVFSAGIEAARIAAAFPASGVAIEDIRQELVRAAILQRIPIEISAPPATP
jgi:hypothetical protein